MNRDHLALFPEFPASYPKASYLSTGARPRASHSLSCGGTRMASSADPSPIQEPGDTFPAFPAFPPQYLARSPLLFTGDAGAMSHLGLSCATRMLEKEHRILRVIDAGNTFNPYVIVRQAQRTGVPAEGWLRRVLVARAFTPYQTLTLLERLPVFYSSPHPPCGPLLILLPFDGLEDTGFSGRERAHLARKILNCLRALSSGENVRLWVVERDSSPLLKPFFRTLLSFCATCIRGEYRDGVLSFSLDSRPADPERRMALSCPTSRQQ